MKRLGSKSYTFHFNSSLVSQIVKCSNFSLLPINDCSLKFFNKDPDLITGGKKKCDFNGKITLSDLSDLQKISLNKNVIKVYQVEL